MRAGRIISDLNVRARSSAAFRINHNTDSCNSGTHVQIQHVAGKSSSEIKVKNVSTPGSGFVELHDVRSRCGCVVKYYRPIIYSDSMTAVINRVKIPYASGNTGKKIVFG